MGKSMMADAGDSKHQDSVPPPIENPIQELIPAKPHLAQCVADLIGASLARLMDRANEMKVLTLKTVGEEIVLGDDKWVPLNSILKPSSFVTTDPSPLTPFFQKLGQVLLSRVETRFPADSDANNSTDTIKPDLRIHLKTLSEARLPDPTAEEIASIKELFHKLPAADQNNLKSRIRDLFLAKRVEVGLISLRDDMENFLKLAGNPVDDFGAHDAHKQLKDAWQVVDYKVNALVRDIKQLNRKFISPKNSWLEGQQTRPEGEILRAFFNGSFKALNAVAFEIQKELNLFGIMDTAIIMLVNRQISESVQLSGLRKTIDQNQMIVQWCATWPNDRGLNPLEYLGAKKKFENLAEALVAFEHGVIETLEDSELLRVDWATNPITAQWGDGETFNLAECFTGYAVAAKLFPDDEAALLAQVLLEGIRAGTYKLNLLVPEADASSDSHTSVFKYQSPSITPENLGLPY